MRALSPVVFVALSAFACRSAPPPAPPKDYARPLPPGRVALERVIDPAAIPDFSAGIEGRDSLLAAVERSLEYYGKPSSKKYFPFLDVSHARAAASLRAFREELLAADCGADLNRRLRERFDVYRSVGWDGSGTVFYTGYCEPIVRGNRTPSARYRYPLYRTPPDLVRTPEGVPLGRRTTEGSIVPYFTREEIDRGGALDGMGLELAWLEDPFDAYIVQVQGSGRVLLPDGSEMKVGYAGKTDRPYASVGQALIRDGKIRREDLSLANLRAHFRRNPVDLERYLPMNASFVFFTEREGGPYGSIGVAVTPRHTLATDKEVYPRGALAFVETSLPRVEMAGSIRTEPWRGFVLDQDTGGAIRSAGRADLFLGTGSQAERVAGHTHAEGRLYYLFLKQERMAAASPRAPRGVDRTFTPP